MGFLDDLRRLTRGGPVRDFDPGLFDDPLAMRVDWSPMARGGANFRTHQGRRVGSQRFEFAPTPMGRIFPAIFVLAGLGGALVMILADGGPSLDPGRALGLLFPLTFVGVGLYIGRVSARSVTFDRVLGWCWRGGTEPRPGDAPDELRVRLSEVHAIQLLPEYIRSDEGTDYTSWELNLVLQDGARLNVVDHAGYLALAREAAELAEFLDVPLWNKNDAYRVEARE